MSCGVGHRRSLDSAWPWLWCRPAAVALIRPVAWEPPDATSVALKKRYKKKVNKLIRAFLLVMGLWRLVQRRPQRKALGNLTMWSDSGKKNLLEGMRLEKDKKEVNV